MEKVQKTVSEIKQVGEPDQYGNLAYVIAFSDQTSGFFRCKDQNLFTLGAEATFYFGKTVGKSGKEYYKIDRVEKHENDFEKKTIPSTGEPGKSLSKGNIEQINRSVAIKAACHLLTGSSNNTPERVIEAAELFFDYIAFGVGDKESSGEIIVKGTDFEILKKETDELPF